MERVWASTSIILCIVDEIARRNGYLNNNNNNTLNSGTTTTASLRTIHTEFIRSYANVNQKLAEPKRIIEFWKSFFVVVVVVHSNRKGSCWSSELFANLLCRCWAIVCGVYTYSVHKSDVVTRANCVLCALCGRNIVWDAIIISQNALWTFQ